jgi:phosphate transport system permease protein
MFDMTELSRKHTSENTKKLLRARRRSESGLKALGIGAIALAVLSLVVLMSTVVGKAAGALFEYSVRLDIPLPQMEQAERDRIADPNPAIVPDLTALIRDQLRAQFPGELDRGARRELFAILSNIVGVELGRQVKANPALADTTVLFRALLDDMPQLYLKGYFGRLDERTTNGVLSPTGTEGTIELLSTSNDFRDELATVKTALVAQAAVVRRGVAQQQNAVDVFTAQRDAATDEAARTAAAQALVGAVANRDRLAAEADGLEARARNPGGPEPLSPELPSILIRINDGWVRATSVDNDRIVGEVISPLSSTADAQGGAWRLFVNALPEAGRRVSDAQVVRIEQLREAGLIERAFNWRFFTAPDSREPELAGMSGALVGSALTLLVTLLLAFPIGVAASIYLEEFAPKNRVTNFIEVNINNLAAVPSIVFGLLGLAVVLPIMNAVVGVNLRSAPLIGGIVMALMSLPTMIIASRAAIRAVPPSIREAALGVGASKLQTALHHVLPLAMPGIMTGTIISLANALGETAPLIMIGMVAFIVDVPTGVTSNATVIPVQIFRWADFPEKLFELKTALAIVTLLVFLVVMNGVAIYLRKRFERRW